MQPEKGEGYDPWGVTDEVWQRRDGVARQQVLNYALYNAPPGTMQHMAVYYYLSAAGSHATERGGAEVYARRYLQAGGGIQDGDRTFSSGTE